jgi:hypothetical protein
MRKPTWQSRWSRFVRYTAPQETGMAQGINAKSGFVVALVAAACIGGFGAEAGSYTALRVANAAVALGFLAMVVRTLGRPLKSTAGFVAKLVIYGGLTVLFAFLTYRAWPTAPVYEVLGSILDEAL